MMTQFVLLVLSSFFLFFFFFNDTATTEIYTLSLHDALPISGRAAGPCVRPRPDLLRSPPARSEEHTSGLQSRSDLVCRLLLEKKKHKQERPKSCYAGSRVTRHTPVPLTA